MADICFVKLVAKQTPHGGIMLEDRYMLVQTDNEERSSAHGGIEYVSWIVEASSTLCLCCEHVDGKNTADGL